jgi:hypothetical protein
MNSVMKYPRLRTGHERRGENRRDKKRSRTAEMKRA